jgi:Kef-type K+ transport system membrane component KefB
MTTRAILTILMVGALTYATRSFVPKGETVTGSGAALAFGFLLIIAVQSAKIFDGLGLPRLTAYILCGLVFGPEMLNVISANMIDDLTIVKGTAVGLIAFLAGCELNFRRLRPQMKAILTTAGFTLLGAGVLLFGFFYGVTYILPVTAGFTSIQRMMVALIASNVLVCYSPAVVIGILSETKAKGPLSEMSMSVVVLADLVIVVTYALASSVARLVFPSAGAGGGFEVLAAHIFGSILAGVIVGGILAGYVARVGTRSGIFTFAILFISAEVGAALHLNPLLIGLAAGLFLENISPVGGETLSQAAQSVAMPTFAIFFAVIGAEVHLRAFIHVAPFAIAGAALRAGGIVLGVRTAARLLDLDPLIRRKLPYGLFPQAGVAIALASLVLGDFRPWGQVVGTVLLGTIVVNELVAPVFFRAALVEAGETNLEQPEETAEPSTA